LLTPNPQRLSLAQLPIHLVGAARTLLGVGSWLTIRLGVGSRELGVVVILFALLQLTPSAQGVDPALLLKPTADSWPTYHGDYSGQHHSRLTQITPANVAQMTLAWAFNTNQTQQIKATPIVVNGVIYITTPDNAWAIDARSGRQLWRYTYPANEGFHIGHRGVSHRSPRRGRAWRSGLSHHA
jgi:alcohol dehydrogenase (cytochrome c)